MNSLMKLLRMQDYKPEYIKDIMELSPDQIELPLLISLCFSYGVIVGKRIERKKRAYTTSRRQ